MARRSEQDIIVTILEAAKEGSRRTHIVYKANLNHELLKRYLNSLMSKGFIALVEERRGIYKTTSKGLEFIEKHRELMEMLK